MFSALQASPEHPQPFFAKALKAVGRASRFERAAAEDLGARLSDGCRRRAHLLVGFRRARSGHHDHLVATYSNVADVNDGVFVLERPARELVRLGDPHHLVDAFHHLDEAGVGTLLSDDAEHRTRDARRPVDVHTQFNQPSDDLFDLPFGGPFFHHNNHGFSRSSSDAVHDC